MYYYLFSIAAITIVLLWLLIRAIKAVAAAQQVDWGKTWLNYIDGLNRLFCQHYHHLQFTSIDLPPQGGAIVVANHLSGVDGFLLIGATRRRLRFLIAREEYERFGFSWLFRAIGSIPVDRSHRPEIALLAAKRALKAGEVIVIFPQGTMVLPGKKFKIKRGAFWLARQTNCLIYPVFISGITGMGHIIRGGLSRSHAKLVGYPPLEGSEETQVTYLQTLFEGKMEPV